jgi:hypothetical protein
MKTNELFLLIELSAFTLTLSIYNPFFSVPHNWKKEQAYESF